MSKMSNLIYDIEQLYIEGHSAKSIALILECPITIIYDWIEGNGVADEQQEEAHYIPDIG